MDTIHIKCTHCGQKYEVEESYIGQNVECGACDKQFKVEGSALVKQKKHYPGEKSATNAVAYTKYQPATPDSSVHNYKYTDVGSGYDQPAKQTKLVMSIMGALFILSCITLFLIHGSEDGLLKDLDNTKRFILAGFVAIAGCGLILSGFQYKLKGILIALLLGGSLIAMPFVFPEVINAKIAKIPNAALATINDTDTETTAKEALAEQLEDYKRNIGFEKVEAARKALDKPDRLKAIILRNSKIVDLDTILPYLQYNLSLLETPVYPYGREIDGEPVTLITFVTDYSFDQVFEITKKFGEPQEMNEIRSTLKVIEVIVDKKTLAPPPAEIISDPLHNRYFHVNYAELKSIDRSRQIEAAKRLQSVTLRGREADIVKALCELININDHKVSRYAISALYHWTLPKYNTNQIVLDYAKTIAGTNTMSRSVMNYLADKDVEGAEEVLAKQWATQKGHILWENNLIRAKKRGELAVISKLPTLSETHIKSAAHILSKVGTAESIAPLTNLLSKENEENKKYLQATIDEIKSRQ